MNNKREFEVEIEFLNERGYGVAFDEERGQVLVLDALPGEIVKVRVFKKKKKILFASAEEIIKKSEFRVEPKEDHFCSCSPWQIMVLEYEKEVKKELISKAFEDFEVKIGEFDVYQPKVEDSWNYRNKVEFGFYGEKQDDGSDLLSISFFKREGGFGKYQLFDGCVLVNKKMNEQALKIVEFLNKKKLVARQLKGLLLRYSNYTKDVVACLYVKDPSLKFSKEEVESLLSDDLKGLMIVYSTEKSPANVVTEKLVDAGEFDLCDKVLGLQITYKYDGFFQINVPVFEEAVKDIILNIDQYLAKKSSKKVKIVDLYAGVGTIGLVLAKNLKKVEASIIGVEIFSGSKENALKNANLNKINNYDFLEAPAEEALDSIEDGEVLIVDPPRVGLHKKVVEKIAEVKPEFLVYLSCNYKTQAENMSYLKDFYELEFFKAYNFYPHTPHVETLGIWRLKD